MNVLNGRLQLAGISDTDAVVIGSGPNGLSAAIVLAQRGLRVHVIEGSSTFGGGARSTELTIPGFVHDLCSAVYPLTAASPFLKGLPLYEHGLQWTYSPAAMAHPFDDGTVALLEHSVDDTSRTLGPDASAYQRLMQPLVDSWHEIDRELLGPVSLPRHPLALARFGFRAFRSATGLCKSLFSEKHARGFFAGLAAHSVLPLEQVPTASFGLVLGIAAHVVQWPVAKGGAQTITNALISYLRSLGGSVTSSTPITAIEEIGRGKTVLCDVTPRQFLQIAGSHLPKRYRRRLERYRYGLGVYKVDWALDGPIPWTAPECSRAATVHLGGTLEEIARSERYAWRGRVVEKPFVILVQPSLFDPTRAPAGKHTGWAYCHVPNGSQVDMTSAIEDQVERFAPGFRDRVLDRKSRGPAELERHNPNLIGGDISGGVHDLSQLVARPTLRMYKTPNRGLYICSSSTPPGGGVHGMCGYFAAQSVLRDLF